MTSFFARCSGVHVPPSRLSNGAAASIGATLLEGVEGSSAPALGRFRSTNRRDGCLAIDGGLVVGARPARVPDAIARVQETGLRVVALVVQVVVDRQRAELSRRAVHRAER